MPNDDVHPCPHCGGTGEIPRRPAGAEPVMVPRSQWQTSREEREALESMDRERSQSASSQRLSKDGVPPYKILFRYQSDSEWSGAYATLQEAVDIVMKLLHGSMGTSCMYDIYDSQGKHVRAYSYIHHKDNQPKPPFKLEAQCQDGWDGCGTFGTLDQAARWARDADKSQGFPGIYRVTDSKGREVDGLTFNAAGDTE